MERIGIAASKIAKDNLTLYNFYVVFIAFLIGLILFLISGGAVFLGLVMIGILVKGVVPSGIDQEWMGLIRLCMVCLSIAIGLIMLFAVAKNVKFRKR